MNKISSITIEELTSFSKDDGESIKQLAEKLGPGFQPLSDDDLKEIVESLATHLLVAREAKNQKIVGMATLAVYRIPYVKKAYFDDFIVLDSYQGRGIGTQLIEKVVTLAKELGASYVDFTSNPKRLTANKFYEKLGFKKRDTNVYRLTFDYAKS